ncbi:sulfurtransferase complex subunit TusB [Ornatilinea apprima]|nr:sulfurtransferase complex subunit TusB [Ornatilinea apprima]
MLVIIKYGAENPGERWKMETTDESDSIVLIQNGVFWAISEEIDPFINHRNIFALKPDFIARGYQESDSKVPLIDYSDLVDLIEKNEKSMG